MDNKAETSHVGELLRRARERRQIPQGEAASLTGWSPSKLSRIENARHGISLEDFQTAVRAYALTADEQSDCSRLLMYTEARFVWTALFNFGSFEEAEAKVAELLRSGTYELAFAVLEAMECMATGQKQNGIVMQLKGSRCMAVGEEELAERHLTNAERYFESAFNESGDPDDLDRLHQILNNRCGLALQQHRYTYVIGVASQVVRDAVDDRRRAYAQCLLGRAGLESGRIEHEEILDLLVTARDTYEELGKPDLVDWCEVHRLAAVLTVTPYDHDAIRRLELMVAKYGPEDDVHDAEIYCRAMGYLGKFHRARVRATECAASAERVAEQSGLKSVIRWLGQLLVLTLPLLCFGTISNIAHGRPASQALAVDKPDGNGFPTFSADSRVRPGISLNLTYYSSLSLPGYNHPASGTYRGPGDTVPPGGGGDAPVGVPSTPGPPHGSALAPSRPQTDHTVVPESASQSAAERQVTRESRCIPNLLW